MMMNSITDRYGLKVEGAIPSIIFQVLVIVSISATGVLYVGIPASPDQLEFDYLGWLVLDGGIPYVDFVDNNWPAGYWFHMISTWLFGNSLHSWRIFDYAIMVIGLGFLADLLRRTVGIISAQWALLLYPGLYTAAHGFWFAGQPDAIISNLFWIALWSHWQAWNKSRPYWQLLTGTILALAMLHKPTAIALAPLLVLHGAFWAKHLKKKRFATFIKQESIAFAAGFATIITAVAIVLLQGSTIDAILESTWLYNIHSQRDPGVTLNMLISKALRTHITSWHWVSLASYMTIIWLLFFDRHTHSPAIYLLITALIAGWMSYFGQGRGFTYHLAITFTGMLPFLFIAIGKLIEYLKPAPLSIKPFIWICIIIVLLGTGKKYYTMYAHTIRWYSGELSTSSYYDNFGAGDGMSLGDIHKLLPELKKSIFPGDTLLMIGTQSAINYLLKARQPIRHYYFPILLEARAPIELVKKWNFFFQKEIFQERSQFAFVNRNQLAAVPRSENEITIQSLNFAKFNIKQSYDKIKEFEEVDLFRRRK